MRVLHHDEAHKLLDNSNWTFAKSMPAKPHEYTLRKNWINSEKFEDVVQFIRIHGIEKKFFKVSYIYYIYNGYQYWTMGAPISDTILINRALI